MRIIVQPHFPEPPISPDGAWKAQGDLSSLLQNKSNQSRDRFYPYNDKYGFGPCLNHIAGLPIEHGIPGILPHGVTPYGKTNHPALAPKQELIESIPCIFASNRRCQEAFLNSGKQHVFPIGLASTYAHASIQAHRPTSGSEPKGSIFFRSHSTPAFNDSIDDSEIIRWLLALPRRYHPIRISTFLFDWKQGQYQAYSDAGLELISAGHPYDPAFIWRHLWLIKSHRYALSTGMGTHIFHALMCSKPVLIKQVKHTYQALRNDFAEHLEAKQHFQQLSKHFSKPSEQPTREQLKLTREWLGIDLTRNPQELKKILLNAREVHNNHKQTNTAKQNPSATNNKKPIQEGILQSTPKRAKEKTINLAKKQSLRHEHTRNREAIPKIIHQFWDGPKRRPTELMEEWANAYTKAGWRYILWDTERLIERLPGKDLANRYQYDQMPQWCGKCDIARYEILYHFGGVYIDADSKFLRLLDNDLLSFELICCYENEFIRPGLVSSGYLGCRQHSPVMAELIKEIGTLRGASLHPDAGKKTTNLVEAWKTTGPVLLTKTIQKLKTINIKPLPSYYFIPNHYASWHPKARYKGPFRPYCDSLWGSTPGSNYSYQDTEKSTNQQKIQNLPQVSICTLTHNRRACIKRLQACIEKQTYPLEKMEWLILDDSTDYADSIEPKSSTAIKINYQRLQNKLTLGAKRNLSHKLCTGEIIVYMDDDDFYFPQRVEHAVHTLRESQTGIAGCTHLHIYFEQDDQLWLSGPFGNNHATAGTFAMTKEFARKHKYDENATCNEEKSFLNGYTIPLRQLDPLKTTICISHSSNTFDKRRMRQKGANARMRPLATEKANPLKQKLLAAGFRHQSHELPPSAGG